MTARVRHHCCIVLTQDAYLQVLQKAGLPDPQLVRLNKMVFQLQCAFERMALVKEYRSAWTCTPLAHCNLNLHSAVTGLSAVWPPLVLYYHIKLRPRGWHVW